MESKAQSERLESKDRKVLLGILDLKDSKAIKDFKARRLIYLDSRSA